MRAVHAILVSSLERSAGNERAHSLEITAEKHTHVMRNSAGRGRNGPIHPRLLAMVQAARYYGVELDRNEFRAVSDKPPSAAALSVWAQNAGMWSRAVRMRWRHLLRFHDSGPVVLLFNDGSAAC